MSRIGKLPIVIPAGVTVTISGNEVKVKGPKGELVQTVSPEIKVEMVDGEIHVTRPNDEKQTRALHGLYRALIHNMVVGVSEGYKKELELVGVGYRAQSQGQVLELSCDKQLIGQVCAKIRSFRKPEPYKGKGIKFVGEVIRRKSGKSAGAK